MTIRDDYRTMVEFWRLYKRIDAIRRELGDGCWTDALAMSSRFGEQHGRLAKRLCIAMLDEMEERNHEDTDGMA